jgi:hypothetical protein
MAEKEDPRVARATFAEAASAALGVPRPIIEAHLKLETGHGANKAIGQYNFGNIKAGKSWQGATAAANVPEYDSSGKAYTEGGAKFRAYKSPEEAGADYAALIQRRFPKAASAQTAEEYASGLKAGGYATDPAYVTKLVKAAGGASAAPAQRPAQPAATGGSTFDRLMAEQQAKQPASEAIANIFDAYQSGRMDPTARAAFEADVKAGKMLLPRGASLAPAADGSAQGLQAPTAGAKLPPGVWDAYQSGQMLPEHRVKLEKDVASGLVAVPQGVKLQQTEAPGFFGRMKEQITGAQRATPETDAAPDWATMPELNSLSMKGLKTGLGTLMSSPDETVKIIQANNPGVTSRQDAKGNWFMTSPSDGKEYAIKPGFQVSDIPRAGSAIAAFTPAGRATSILGAGAAGAATQAAVEATQAATGGEFNGGEVATAGLMGGLAPALGAAAKAAAPAVRNVIAKAGGTAPVASSGAKDVASAAAGEAGQSAMSKLIGLPESVTTLPRRALDAVRGKATEAVPTPGTMGSAGAAATDAATQRIATAEQLGFTGEAGLTAGQATRDAAQLKFEVESAKLPGAGAPLRQRVVKQNDQILRNFDDWIDKSGAEAPNPRAVGQSVDDALVKQVARDKTQIRAAYKAAETAGEMEAPVVLDNVVAHLNEAAPEAAVSPILGVARARAKQLGIVAEDEAGNLVAQPVPLKTAELFRRSIGNATDYAPTNIRQSSIIKGLVDEATDGAGGQAYKAARALRSQFAQTYENRAAVAKLIGTKRGTADRQVALEDVFTHSIIKSSADDITHLQGVLQKAGDEGAQAWKDLQGQTMQWIKDEATKNVATHADGARVVSPAALDKAIRSLDNDGRLDIVLGKKGAERMRDIRDLALYMKTVPPEAAVNTSNTAATLLQAFADAGLSGAVTGIPLPVMTAWKAAKGYIADRALAARIEAALSRNTAKAPKKGF